MISLLILYFNFLCILRNIYVANRILKVHIEYEESKNRNVRIPHKANRNISSTQASSTELA